MAATADGDRRARRPVLARTTWLVIATGVTLTAVLAFAAYVAHDDNEDRLLHQRTIEVAAVLESSIRAVAGPLAEVATLAEADIDDDWEDVEAAMHFQVAEDRFDSMAIIDLVDGRRVMKVGEPAKVEDPLTAVGRDVTVGGGGPDADATSGHLHVVDLLEGPNPRIGYLHRPDPVSRTALYAERALPEQVSAIPAGEAFAGLDFALYLGEDESRSSLLRASTEELPLDGRRDETSLPFGDSTITVVTSPTGVLGSALLARLPWLVLVAGLVATAGGASLVEAIHGRRRHAEGLAQEVARLYGREHAIAHTLQHSLLPRELPTIERVDLAARYIAGAAGTEVGGDWYDVIELDDDRFAVIVGDVAGRGVRAAAVMAAMRYASHTLAAEGHDPDRVLTTINQLDNIRGDFVTMLCATINLRDGTMALARAGHPPPLLIEGEAARFLDTSPGPPIGFLPTTMYHADRVELPPSAILLLYTDGLCERRGEDIDVSLERLRRAAASGGRDDLDAFLDHLYDELVGEDGRDDVAMLAVRVTVPRPATEGGAA